MAMAEGRRRHDWEMQAALMALVAQAAGDKDATPDRFNPYEQEDEEPPEVITFSEARELLRNHH